MIASPLKTRRCRSCGETKPLDEFPRDRTLKEGRRATCRECKRKRERGAWRAKHPTYPVGPFQRRFRELQEKGIGADQIARNLGWMDPNYPNSPNTQRVRRALGLEPEPEWRKGRRHIRWRKTVRHDTAKRLAEAMYCDPVDLGF